MSWSSGSTSERNTVCGSTASYHEVMSSGADSHGVWLVLDGHVLATLEEATTRSERRRGLLGRDHIEGVLRLTPARSVHTFGMRFPIDVVHLDKDLRVLRVSTMVPNRLGAFVPRSHSVLEAEAGAMAHWGVSVGDQLEIR
jgi:uncharacterized membrane protein (UPF0127 family)